MVLEIDNIDKRILFELDKNARIPETALAKMVNRSKESIRHRINKLREEKILLGNRLWIDFTKLGYSIGKIYLNLANVSKRKREFIDYIKKDKRLFWLGIAEGEWNCGITYFVKNNFEFFDLKNELFSKFKDLIHTSQICSVVNINISNKTFFYDENNHWISAFESPTSYLLDEKEKKILVSLSKDSRKNVVNIANETGLTVDVIRNRIKKLEEAKVIFRYGAIIDFNKLGYEFFKSFLHFRNLSKEDEKKLFDYCLRNKKIIHLVKSISN